MYLMITLMINDYVWTTTHRHYLGVISSNSMPAIYCTKSVRIPKQMRYDEQILWSVSITEVTDADKNKFWNHLIFCSSTTHLINTITVRLIPIYTFDFMNEVGRGLHLATTCSRSAGPAQLVPPGAGHNCLGARVKLWGLSPERRLSRGSWECFASLWPQ